MKKIKIVALVSAVITALLLFAFLSSLNQPDKGEKVTILTAAADIPANTTIGAEMIKKVELSSEAIPAGALTEESQAVGKVSRGQIFSGEQLLAAKLASAGGGSDSKTLALAIEPGMRAISIPADESTGVAYMLTPGDHVDVIAQFVTTTNTTAVGNNSYNKTSYTTMLAENITVLAVDNVFSEDGKLGSDVPAYTTLTLQVTPKQAMELSMAQFEGQLRAVLRSPTDEKQTNQPTLTLDKVMKK